MGSIPYWSEYKNKFKDLFDGVAVAPRTGTTYRLTGDLEVSDFTKLGSTAPVIKMKKLTGTTGGTEGDTTDLTHGLTVSKIIGCQVFVTQSSNNLVPPAFTDVAEHEYEFFILVNVVRVLLTATNSGSIINGAITVLLTYEE